MIYEKYCASGNDFVIFSSFKKGDFSKLAIKLCDRFYGIGGDGLIAILPHETYDFEWAFYNSDGSVANMCGNGARAAAAFAYKHNICGQNCAFLTGAGVIKAKIEPQNSVEITLTTPKILSEPFTQNGFLWHFIDTGVPHLVAIVDDLEQFNIDLCQKMRQEYDANVNFALFDKDILKVRTFERGVEGETLACGTGMAASFLAFNGDGDSEYIKVMPKSGEILKLKSQNKTVFFKGEVKNSFTAIVD